MKTFIAFGKRDPSEGPQHRAQEPTSQLFGILVDEELTAVAAALEDGNLAMFKRVWGEDRPVVYVNPANVLFLHDVTD